MPTNVCPCLAQCVEMLGEAALQCCQDMQGEGPVPEGGGHG